MKLLINEAAKRAGVSVRTLHFYDEKGLLRPCEVTKAGYRFYGDAELRRLRQILFLREMEFSLGEIGELLESGDAPSLEAVMRQREILCLKRERLDGLIELTDKILKGETEMSFKEFDGSKIELEREKYAEEAKKKWGNTEAYKESQKKEANYKSADWAAIQAEMEAIFARFAAIRTTDPASDEAKALVKTWQDYITLRQYNCTDEILAGLGEMYAADERFAANIDKQGAGTAKFMSEAIKAYCKK